MEIIKTAIEGVFEIIPRKFEDDRGCFFETYHVDKFKDAGLDYHFVQDNQSESNKGVLRGLHYQEGQYAQAKLVRAVKGRVYDVVADLRAESSTFGKWVGVELTEEKGNMLMVPPPFAHGFLVVSDSAVVTYKCSSVYHPEAEAAIMWNDPILAIDWPLEGLPLLSRKDQINVQFDPDKTYF